MDFFLWLVVAISQILLGFLGILAINSEFATSHFQWFVTAFSTLSLAGVIAGVCAFVRSTRSSDMVAQLTEQILYEVKGSPESSLVLLPNFSSAFGGSEEEGKAVLQAFNRSKYPMIDVHIGTVGHSGIDQRLPEMHFGSLNPGQGLTFTETKLNLRKDVDNMIEFSIVARSVTLWEEIVISWNGTGWAYGYSMFKEVDGKSVYLKRIRDDFPYVDKSTKQVVEHSQKPRSEN